MFELPDKNEINEVPHLQGLRDVFGDLLACAIDEAKGCFTLGDAQNAARAAGIQTLARVTRPDDASLDLYNT